MLRPIFRCFVVAMWVLGASSAWAQVGGGGFGGGLGLQGFQFDPRYPYYQPVGAGRVSFSPFDTTLTEAQRAEIQAAHELAWQQVNLSLQYLTIRAPQILAGNDNLYNSHFGQFYDTSPGNPLAGQYSTTRPGVVVDRSGVGQVEGVNGTTITFVEGTSPRSIEVGDVVYVGGELRTVTGVDIREEQMSVTVPAPPGQGNGEDREIQFTVRELQSITIDEELSGNRIVTGTMVGKAVDVGTTLDRDHYDRVVNAFQTIRELLEQDTLYIGDPDLAMNGFDRVFAADRATLEIDGTTTVNGHVLDRSFRQFGLSNSGSELHLDQLLNDPDNPLLWTQDEYELFFNEHLTLFAEIGLSGNTVYVGGAFLNGQQEHAGGLFDGFPSDDVVSTPEAYAQIIAAFSEFGWSLFSPENGEFLNMQGDPLLGAAFGMMEIMQQMGTPNGTSDFPFPQNADPQNYGAFADPSGSPLEGTGVGTTSLLPPPGKNAEAVPSNFQPVVPIR